MKKIITFMPFNIFILEVDAWEFGYHNHNFYEIILVLEGRGSHIINEISYQYKQGDIFSLTPVDAHTFVIDEKSRFIFIKYTEPFLSGLISSDRHRSWEKSIRAMLFQNPYNCKKILQNKDEKDFFFLIADKLLQEFQMKSDFYEELISHLFLSLTTIMTRDFRDKTLSQKTTFQNNEIISRILAYISLHASDAEKVSINSLAKEFFMSKNYIGSYIRKKTGFSLSYFIKQHKIRTAEKLLAQQTLNISEIAFALGFNDTSHFSNFFKKHHDLSPTKYREEFYATRNLKDLL